MRAVLVVFLFVAVATALLPFADKPKAAPNGDWPVYGHDPGGQQYSPLTGINRQNVNALRRCMDLSDGGCVPAGAWQPYVV